MTTEPTKIIEDLVGGLVAMNFIFPLILGMSSSQLTNSYFSEGWPNHQPEIPLDPIRSMNFQKTLGFEQLRASRRRHGVTELRVAEFRVSWKVCAILLIVWLVVMMGRINLLKLGYKCVYVV